METGQQDPGDSALLACSSAPKLKEAHTQEMIVVTITGKQCHMLLGDAACGRRSFHEWGNPVESG